MTQVCWLSIDPVRRKIDYYPKAIAMRIEKAYGERNIYTPSTCVLGKDFFNSTIHFHHSGSCYQTTPGIYMGRAGFKQPGYRSVKRLIKPNTDNFIIYSKQVHGEWRLASSEYDSEITFRQCIPPECLIELGQNCYTITTWNSEDLKPSPGELNSNDRNNINVVSWQWCRGVQERQGNLLELTNEWWCPYLENHNQVIEEAFSSGFTSIQIGDRRIDFVPQQSFARQFDESGTKERMVRRVITTVKDIKKMLETMANPPQDIADIFSNLPDGTIPHHFFCAITQDIMKDPVTTIDNFTYERTAIERWFEEHSTSPLTGLSLSSKVLVANTVLFTQINDFIDSHK